MALTINSLAENISAQRQLGLSSLQNKSLSHLASGLGINQSSDDPAGSSIVDLMNANIRGISRYIGNAYDGVSVTKTADAGLQGSTSILQQMRELAVQSGNGALNDSDRASIQKEMDQLRSEYDQIAEQTEYNGINLLDGSYYDDFHTVNQGKEVQINIQIGDVRTVLNPTIDVTTSSNASDALDKIDSALNEISKTRSDLGAIQNSFKTTISELSSRIEMLSTAQSRIGDLDYASESNQWNALKVLQEAGIHAQSQANYAKSNVFNLLFK